MTSTNSLRTDDVRPVAAAILPASLAASLSASRDTAAGRRALAHVFALLEQLADVLAAPQLDMSQLEAVVCGCIAHLRAAGVPGREVAGRLTRLVHAASAHTGCASEMAARVSAVVAWCERSAHPAIGSGHRDPH